MADHDSVPLEPVTLCCNSSCPLKGDCGRYSAVRLMDSSAIYRFEFFHTAAGPECLRKLPVGFPVVA